MLKFGGYVAVITVLRHTVFILQEYSLSDERKTTQKDIDDKLLPLIAGVPSLKQYLRHKFTLSHGQYPHLMVF